MKRFASVRFDGVLGASERDEITRAYRSAGATVTSWAASATRSYVTLAFAPGADDVPPALAVLRVTPRAPCMVRALECALGGAGRPAGSADVYRDGDAVVIELDPERSSVALVVATIDVELGPAPGRTIEALVPLDDATLTAYAGFLLGEPALDASRLIETYLEPLIAASRA